MEKSWWYAFVFILTAFTLTSACLIQVDLWPCGMLAGFTARLLITATVTCAQKHVRCAWAPSVRLSLSSAILAPADRSAVAHTRPLSICCQSAVSWWFMTCNVFPPCCVFYRCLSFILKTCRLMFNPQSQKICDFPSHKKLKRFIPKVDFFFILMIWFLFGITILHV